MRPHFKNCNAPRGKLTVPKKGILAKYTSLKPIPTTALIIEIAKKMRYCLIEKNADFVEEYTKHKIIAHRAHEANSIPVVTINWPGSVGLKIKRFPPTTVTVSCNKNEFITNPKMKSKIAVTTVVATSLRYFFIPVSLVEVIF
jgi:hypothetical protein